MAARAAAKARFIDNGLCQYTLVIPAKKYSSSAESKNSTSFGIQRCHRCRRRCLRDPMAVSWLIWARCASSSADRKSTRLNSSHVEISYAVFCLKKKKKKKRIYFRQRKKKK